MGKHTEPCGRSIRCELALTAVRRSVGPATRRSWTRPGWSSPEVFLPSAAPNAVCIDDLQDDFQPLVCDEVQ